MITLSVKQGATFHATISFAGPQGARLDLSACTFACSIRDVLGNPIATLACAQPVRVPWALNITSPTGPVTWPVGRYFSDLRVTDATGTVVLTETFAVSVQDAITGATS